MLNAHQEVNPFSASPNLVQRLIQQISISDHCEPVANKERRNERREDGVGKAVIARVVAGHWELSFEMG
jgi:hypothetical protein